MNIFGSRRTTGIERERLIEEAEYVVLDTELTGLDVRKDAIVSIGCVRMTGSRISLGDTFYRVVKPETALTSESVLIHGIMPSEVEEMPGIGEALAGLIAFVGDAVIIGHFVSIDMAFLRRALKRGLSVSLANPVADTLSLYEWLKSQEKGGSRHFDGNGENKDLFTIAKKYGIEVNGAHNALKDAFITAQVFQRFLRYLPRHGVRTLGDLLRVGRP